MRRVRRPSGDREREEALANAHAVQRERAVTRRRRRASVLFALGALLALILLFVVLFRDDGSASPVLRLGLLSLLVTAGLLSAALSYRNLLLLRVSRTTTLRRRASADRDIHIAHGDTYDISQAGAVGDVAFHARSRRIDLDDMYEAGDDLDEVLRLVRLMDDESVSSSTRAMARAAFKEKVLGRREQAVDPIAMLAASPRSASASMRAGGSEMRATRHAESGVGPLRRALTRLNAACLEYKPVWDFVGTILIPVLVALIALAGVVLWTADDSDAEPPTTTTTTVLNVVPDSD